jgi:hypothetical protein
VLIFCGRAERGRRIVPTILCASSQRKQKQKAPLSNHLHNHESKVGAARVSLHLQKWSQYKANSHQQKLRTIHVRWQRGTQTSLFDL